MGGTGVSSFQATPPLLDVCSPVSVSLRVDLSGGPLHDIFSSTRGGNVQVSSGPPGVSGRLVSLALTSPSVSRIVPDVSPFVSTHAIPGTSYPPVSFSPVPPYPPL